MARVPGLFKPCLEGGLMHGGRVIGAELEPGTQSGLLGIGWPVAVDARISDLPAVPAPCR